MPRILIVFLVLVFSLQAKESHRHQITPVPDTSRYAMMQSELSASITLKLDKFTGKTFQLLESSKKGLYWLEIKTEKHPQDIVQNAKVNYQLFSSGLAVKMTYLMNINTGATWQMMEDSKIGVFWQAIH